MPARGRGLFFDPVDVCFCAQEEGFAEIPSSILWGILEVDERGRRAELGEALQLLPWTELRTLLLAAAEDVEHMSLGPACRRKRLENLYQIYYTIEYASVKNNWLGDRHLGTVAATRGVAAVPRWQ